MSNFLTEAYTKVTRLSGGVPPTDLRSFRKTYLANDNRWNTYIRALSEGLNETDRKNFTIISENTREALMENAASSINPYETLVVPVLRKFYPRLIARELVHTTPIDKPEVIRVFIRAYFGRGISGEADDHVYPYQFPYIASNSRISAYLPGDATPESLVEISRGPSAGINSDATADAGTTDIFASAFSGITRDEAHIERDFSILSVIDSTGTEIALSKPISPDVDGNFSFDVDVDGTPLDTVVGRINYETGVLDWQSVNGDITSLYYRATLSLEENRINPKVKYVPEKIRLVAILRQIGADWTIPFEQDLKALYDIDLQTELVNIMGEQIAIEIDRQVIDELIQGCYVNNGATHIDSWSKTPDETFAWGQKMWMETILPKVNHLSAVVYNSTQMGQANVIACNPIDAAIFESLNDFNYTGSSSEGGDVGYSTAAVAGGKYKILTSSIVPQGKMILVYKVPDETRACYLYAPYQMPILTPYPLGYRPAMTIMSRYATKLVRPEGIAVLKITS
mgnify:CR=1 FL=1